LRLTFHKQQFVTSVYNDIYLILVNIGFERETAIHANILCAFPMVQHISRFVFKPSGIESQLNSMRKSKSDFFISLFSLKKNADKSYVFSQEYLKKTRFI
jgi:hypothetical protein